MAKISKRRQQIKSQIVSGNVYSYSEAINLLKQLPLAKFRESVDVSVMLGVDPRKSDQAVRGSSVLPHGIGKTVRVAVFTQGANINTALSAGADRVGMDDLAQEMQEGQINYDVVIASPDAMGVVGRLGTLLGPKGLMPNPKVGTVTMDVATAVRNAKSGQVRFRADKNGIIHCSIGKIDFDNQALKENLATLLTELRKVKPVTAKGVYIKKVILSTTMGPGLVVDEASVSAS